MVRIQNGGARRLEFRKTVAIPLLFERYAPNFVRQLRIQCITHTAREITAQRSEVKMVAAATLSLRKNISNSTLFYQLDYARLNCCKPDIEVALVYLVLCIH